MPTPFMHLDIAERIRRHGALPRVTHERLVRHWPAFYLGNVAADFQTIADVPREATHFYNLPPKPGVAAHEQMLRVYPELAHSDRLQGDQAVFVAGYQAHLLLDLRWYRHVLTPFFFEAEDWPEDHRHRFLVHNILLTYLDREARRMLPPEAGGTLALATPRHWLPFASDGDLLRWRDMLVRQLAPGAHAETVSIYAQRLKMTPAAFARNLEDPQWLKDRVFARVPLGAVQDVLSVGLEQSVGVVAAYLT